jgi:predicted dehydrogenase
MCRYHPQTFKAQELIQKGVIGELRLIRSIFSITLWKPGDIRFDPGLGGGSLWDLGTYPVTFSRAMVQADPVEVMGWQVAGESGIDLTFMGQMRFATGTLAQFSCSFQGAPQTDAELIGSRGLMQLDLPWVNRVGESAHMRLLHEGERRLEGFGDSRSHFQDETITYENCNAYQCEVDAMAYSILNGADPLLPISDSRGNVATVAALYRSARENRPIQVKTAPIMAARSTK